MSLRKRHTCEECKRPSDGPICLACAERYLRPEDEGDAFEARTLARETRLTPEEERSLDALIATHEDAE